MHAQSCFCECQQHHCAQNFLLKSFALPPDCLEEGVEAKRRTTEECRNTASHCSAKKQQVKTDPCDLDQPNTHLGLSRLRLSTTRGEAVICLCGTVRKHGNPWCIAARKQPPKKSKPCCHRVGLKRYQVASRKCCLTQLTRNETDDKTQRTSDMDLQGSTQQAQAQ